MLFGKPSTLRAVELLTEVTGETYGTVTDRLIVDTREGPISINNGLVVSFANRKKAREIVTSL